MKKLRIFFTTKNDGIMEWSDIECDKSIVKDESLVLYKGGLEVAYFVKFLYYKLI